MNVGDKVKVVELSKNDKEDTNLSIGDIGTIVHIDDNGIDDLYDVAFPENIIIKEDSCNRNYDGSYAFFDYEVEKVEE